MKRDGPPTGMTCITCQVRQSTWRCLDCLGQQHQCTDCFRHGHRLLPFHRVEHWKGTHFESAWLCQVGVAIHLGHQGQPCPAPQHEDPYHGDVSDAESEWEDDDKNFASDLPHGLPKLKSRNAKIIVDRSGVHRLEVIPCRCDSSYLIDMQYMDMGLFPSSFEQVKTAFTFGVLNDFRMDNVECKTSAYNYYNKLVRLTSNEFPQSVPVSLCYTNAVKLWTDYSKDRYRELMRVSRMWRNLKYRKWHGFAHSKDVNPGPGDLALFCVACPQPGINLPDRWEDDPEQYVTSGPTFGCRLIELLQVEILKGFRV